MAWLTHRAVSGVLVSLGILLSVVSCAQDDQTGAAETAYQLRMDGKLDEGVKILEEALEKDPDYAAGHFELSRSKVHMALGKPRQIEGLLDEAQLSIDRAITLKADNAAYAYYAGNLGFLRAFLGLQTGRPDAGETVVHCCEAFEAALRLEPEYPEAMLHLIEIYGLLPEEVGGDSAKARSYLAEAEQIDKVHATKARSVLGEVGVEEWSAMLNLHPGRADVLAELGRAYLYEEDWEKAGEFFEDAVKLDPRQADLFLDLGRYHIMHLMRLSRSEDQGSMPTHLAGAEEAIGRYLELDHPAPLEAYALSMLARVKHGAGEEQESIRLKEEAEALDPYHSRATGGPSQVLFAPVGQIVHDHRYLMRPF